METMIVQKQMFENFVMDLGKLLSDFEKMLDTSLAIETKQRLNELKSGKEAGFSEADYKKFAKKKLSS